MRYSGVLAAAAAVFAALAAPNAARAQVSFEAAALTDFPVMVGVEGQIELPYRITGSVDFGFMPKLYLDTINSVSTGAGFYDQETADVISAALDTALVLRLHAGWRPFDGHGFYFDLGYTLAALGGGLSAAEALADASDQDLSRLMGEDLTRRFDISSTLHMFGLRVGWRWELPYNVFIRANVGVMATFASSTSVKPDFTPRRADLVQRFTTAAEVYLDDVYTKYVFGPTAGVSVGYHFE